MQLFTVLGPHPKECGRGCASLATSRPLSREELYLQADGANMGDLTQRPTEATDQDHWSVHFQRAPRGQGTVTS